MKRLINKKNKIQIPALFISLFIINWYTTSAAGVGDTLRTFIEDITRLIGETIANLLLTVAVAFFLLAVVVFIKNRSIGAEGQGYKDAKERLGWSIVALFVMFSIWGIITFLQDGFQFKNNNITSPSLMLGGGSGPGSGNISGSPQISNTPTTQSTAAPSRSNTPTTQSTAAPSRSNTPDSTQQQTSIEKVTAISGKYYKLALKSKERYDTNNLKEFRNFKVSCQLEGVSYNDDSCIGNLQGIDKNNTIDIKVNKCYSKGMSLFNRNVIDASIFRIYDCDMNNNTKTYVYTLTAGKTYDTNLLKDFAYVKINCNYTDPNFCLKEKQVVNFVNGKFLILDSNSCYNKGLNLYNTNSFDSVNLRFIDCAPKK